MVLLICIALYLALNLGLGFAAARRVRSSEDFVLAGRRLGMGMVATTIFATWFGSETLMSSSAIFAEGGVLAVIKDPFGAVLCLGLLGLFFVKPLYRMHLVTLSDFFRRRFGRAAEWASAALLSFSYLSWIAAQLVAMGTIASVLCTGAGFPLSVHAGICIGAALVALYTVVGGMWAVSWTDLLQSAVIAVGLVVMVVLLVLEWGGITSILSAQPRGFFRFVPKGDPASVLTYAESWIVVGLGSIASQDVFQRTFAARDEKTAVRATWLAGALYLAVALLPLLIGLYGKAYYPALLSGTEEQKQMLLPSLVMAHSPIWVQGLIFGALLSAIMSTTSGAILAPAAVVTGNMVKPLFPRISDRALLWVLRASVLLMAGLALVQALGGESIYQLAADSSAMTLVTLVVPLTLGLYWRGATNVGALASMVVGAVVWIVWDRLFKASIVPSILPALLAGVAAMLATGVGNRRSSCRAA